MYSGIIFKSFASLFFSTFVSTTTKVLDSFSSWSTVSLMPLLNGSVADNAPDVVKTLAELKASGKISHYGDFTKPFNSQFTTDWRTYLTAFAESYSNGSDMSADDCLSEMQAKFDQDVAES